MRNLPCSLQRFQASVQRSGFVARFWYQFNFKVSVAVFLQPIDLLRLHLVTLAIFVDRAEVALGATAVLIQYQGSSWSVPTPPVAVIALPDRVTSSSSRSSGGDAVES